jgi:carbamoyl-phosphate synthase small subunit
LYRDVIGTTLKIIEENLPVFGICLGCQIIALALGGDTYKLKFGHRGQNHPCIDLETKRCFITSQNHGYAIDGTSIQGRGLDVAFINANDRTVEGIRHYSLPVMAAQFHPEASPGPNDTNGLFDEFLGTLRPGRRGINAQV